MPQKKTFVIFTVVLNTLGVSFFAALSYIKILHKSIIIQYSCKPKKYQFYFMLSWTVKNDHCY